MPTYEKTNAFEALHKSGDPLILYNVWDAGSAAAVANAGAKAIATGSWSVAEAQGFPDGEKIPLDLLLKIASNIAASTDLPCTLDFEGGYADSPKGVAENIERVLETGVVGINFEDQRVGEEGLYEISEQCARIRAIRQKAEAAGVPFFINARTDLFLKAGPDADLKALLAQAKERLHAYADAGASGFFAPALAKTDLIADLCDASPLPVNIMMMKGVPACAELAALGVARISYGPGPYVEAMKNLTRRAELIFKGEA